MLSGAGLGLGRAAPQTKNAATPGAAAPAVNIDTLLPDQVLLKDYRPESIYKIKASDIKRAKFPIVDAHHHGARNSDRLERDLKTMNEVGVQSAVAFAPVGEGQIYRAEVFDTVYQLHSKYPKRFHVYTGLDLRDCDQPAWRPDKAVAELERCHKMGAVGVGELHDRGMGIGGVPIDPPDWLPTAGPARQPRTPVKGFHPDAPQLDPIWDKCADLGMPVNLHVSDPYWAYLPQNRFNDGLMNAYAWRLDDKPGILPHNELIESYEAAVKKHPRTVFIASHLMNLPYDLNRLGGIFERNPNFYADFSSCFHETCTIPRTTANFLKRWADRVMYATDMPYSQHIFSLTFRILESADDHFYDHEAPHNFNYHWPMYGMDLPDDVLRKVYHETALSAFRQAQSKARG